MVGVCGREVAGRDDGHAREGLQRDPKTGQCLAQAPLAFLRVSADVLACVHGLGADLDRKPRRLADDAAAADDEAAATRSQARVEVVQRVQQKRGAVRCGEAREDGVVEYEERHHTLGPFDSRGEGGMVVHAQVASEEHDGSTSSGVRGHCRDGRHVGMGPNLESDLRAALAGVAAAAVWAMAEPGLRRAFGTPYTDVRLLGAPLSRRHWRLAGAAAHLANGAAAGIAFRRLGLHGWRRAVVAAELEGAALWPAMAVVDRFHPDRRSGDWPPLLRNPRVFAQEIAAHAIFGGVLGVLLRTSPS